jgi:penicillin-binding protein 1A
MNLASATIASDNTVFAQLDLDVGPEEVAETAKKMGITTELDGIPAEGLGGLRIGVSPLEMASAYATLADGGIYRKPTAIRKVEFPDGHVSHPTQAEPKRVLPENVAYEVTQILADNMTSGTGTSAYTGCYGQAGKTGTTDNYTDAWFVGYQPNVSTAVWVGYPESNDIEMYSVHGVSVAGGTFPAEIWNTFTSNTGTPCEDFPVPEDPIEWSQFFGEYSSSYSTDSYDTDDSYDSSGYDDYEEPSAEGGGTTYDPDLYAPGAGQAPAPAPTIPAPAPAPVSPGGGISPG